VYFIITYLKGAHVIRTLQWVLGDEAFFAALSSYAASHVWSPESPAMVTVDAFREEMEGASGTDLTGFFEQWVYGTGHPVYSWAAEFGGGVESGYTARVRVEQIQDTGVLYDVPVEISVWVSDEEEPRRFRVGFDGAVADETFPLDAEPRGLKVDDRWWIWGDRIPELVGDLDGSNEVDGIDLIYMAWSQGGDYTDTAGAYNYITESDLDRDWDIDDDDLAALLAAFGDKGAIDE